MICQILFSRKNKKNIISLSSVEIVHSMVSVLTGLVDFLMICQINADRMVCLC